MRGERGEVGKGGGGREGGRRMEEEVSISIPSISFPSLPSSAGPQMRKVRSDDLIGQQNRALPTEEVGSGMGMRQNSLEDIADQTMATPTETRPPENVEVCVCACVRVWWWW